MKFKEEERNREKEVVIEKGKKRTGLRHTAQRRRRERVESHTLEKTIDINFKPNQILI